MEYKTGDVAKIVGLTSQTMRDYENQGFLEAEKDEESGYRYFNGMMVSKAIAIRSLRNLGFSLPEVSNLFQPMDYETYCSHFDAILCRQEAALEKQRLICDLAREQTMRVHNIRESLHICQLEENLSFYCLDYLHSGTTLLKTSQEIAIMNRWVDCGMFTRNYSPLDGDTTSNTHAMGLAVRKDLAERLKIPIEKPVYQRVCPLVISMMGKHQMGSLPGKEEIAYIRFFAEANRLRLLDGAFIVSQFTFWDEKEEHETNYSMLYFPVEKN